MISIQAIKKIYFIGIGGIGMSGLARYFLARGAHVSGYDKTPTPLTRELEQAGIAVHYTDDPDLVPPDADVVCYTPAIPPDQRELQYCLQQHFTVLKRSDLLEEVTRHAFTIAIAGTHGKTTTTTLLAHILKSSGYDCTAFLGGISANYNTNFLSGNNNTIVVEADEFDRSFWKLHPDLAVITSVDPDHLDIYGDAATFEEGFEGFARKLKPGGRLLLKQHLPLAGKLSDLAPSTYALQDPTADFYAADIFPERDLLHFRFHTPISTSGPAVLGIPGQHNLENAVAAAAVAWMLGVELEAIGTALESFRGVKRRFEYILRSERHIYIDDYAHHPKEIRAFLQSLRFIYPDKKITCIFQPHLYSRTRDFAADFAASLSLADALILLPIYPARELPIPGVDSEMILEMTDAPERCVVKKEEVLDLLEKTKPELLVTVGAGDIDTLVEPIRVLLTKLSKANA